MIPHKSLNIYSWQDVMHIVRFLVDQIAEDGIPDLIVGIPRGGMLIATLIAELLNRDLLALYVSRRVNGQEVHEKPIVKCPIPAELVRGKRILLTDEIAVTGQTLEVASAVLKNLGASDVRTCVLVNRSRGACVCCYSYACTQDDCSIFPWDYLVRCKNGDYCVHPEYRAMDKTLPSDLYEEANAEPEPPELPKEAHKGLSALFLVALKQQFKDDLLGVYLYGSVLGEDFAARSDIDFIVLLRTLPMNAEEIVRALHRKLAKKHPAAQRLEGGYHVIDSGSASGRRMGLWVDEGGNVERCELELEPDSAASIIDDGLILWGPSLERWYPRPERAELYRFSKRYLLEFEARLPERLNSANHFFSSVLNACRSICYCMDGNFPTKAAAARRVEWLFPDGKALLEKALAYRNGKGTDEFTDEDIHACQAMIVQALATIEQRGIQ